MPEPTPTNMTAPEHQGPAALLARLISIDSANPDLGPSAGEAVIADFAGEWLTARGFEVHRLEQRRGRLSIVAVAHGSGGGRSLMLNGHLDTVGLGGFDGDPLTPAIREGRMFGRGRGDQKPQFDHAAAPSYSWMSPPSRSRRRTSHGLAAIGSPAATSGEARPRARCGRCRL